MVTCTLDSITAEANAPTPEAIKIEREQQLDAFMELRRALEENHPPANMVAAIRVV